jgi:hypothetical protein
MQDIRPSLALAISLAMAACSPSPESPTDADIAAQESAAAATDDSATTATPGTTPPVATGTPASQAERNTLALEGLGDLVVGKPVPAGSSFAERGAQISEDCRTISSPDYPGVYAITDGEGGPVRRITVGQRSDVKLVEGIGVGATEKAVLAAFPGFRASPHKYVDAPGKYLTQPGNDPRLRFEIGQDGRVSLVHVGLMPELGYVEGCA